MLLIVDTAFDEGEQLCKLAVALQTADCRHVPLMEHTLDKFLVFFPRQRLREEEVLGWDAVLNTGRPDYNLEVCAYRLHVQA